MPSRNRGRGGLTQGLDREVYQVVRKILDQRAQQTGPNIPWDAATTIYDEIRRSNSSLNRKPKKLLTDSIERVLATIKQDEEETDSEEAIERSEEATVRSHLPSNGLNRSIVSAWSTSVAQKLDSGTSQSQEQGSEDTAMAFATAEATTKKRQVNGEPLPKRRKATSSTVVDRSPPTNVSLADFGGIDHIVEQLISLTILPLKGAKYFAAVGTQPARGVLIYGPSGCGKTMLVNAIAAELGVNFISISAPSVVSGMSGESEKALRDLFEEAKSCAPCMMFIDEIDAITPKRESAQREMEKRIVAQLLTCMDDLDLANTNGKPVIVMATTNRPDALDPALRRAGRFDKEINMSVPDEVAREKILQAMLRKLSISPDIDCALLARRTPGFVGADLKNLVSAASNAVIERFLNIHKSRAGDSGVVETNMLSLYRYLIKFFDEQDSTQETTSQIEESISLDQSALQVTMADFLISLPKIQPSALREGFATIPSTTFDAIGALSTHIGQLRQCIINPILTPERYSALGISPPAGVLLWGPPGCGKTLLAKAVANSSHANFIAVNGPELLNKYVGESERAVRQVFTRARSSVPVIIFFDEFDALVPRREATLSEASARVVNTLLSELDGVGQNREGIYIIAATNRPDTIDPAMLRPGRLDSLIFVGLPDQEGRVDILRTLCKKVPNFTFTEEMADVARACKDFSGADLQMLLQKAGIAALERGGDPHAMDHDLGGAKRDILLVEDFQLARTQVMASVRPEDMKKFEKLKRQGVRTE